MLSCCQQQRQQQVRRLTACYFPGHGHNHPKHSALHKQQRIPPQSAAAASLCLTCSAVAAAALLMPLTSTADGSSATAYMGVATRQRGGWDLVGGGEQDNRQAVEHKCCNTIAVSTGNNDKAALVTAPCTHTHTRGPLCPSLPCFALLCAAACLPACLTSVCLSCGRACHQAPGSSSHHPWSPTPPLQERHSST